MCINGRNVIGAILPFLVVVTSAIIYDTKYVPASNIGSIAAYCTNPLDIVPKAAICIIVPSQESSESGIGNARSMKMNIINPLPFLIILHLP